MSITFSSGWIIIGGLSILFVLLSILSGMFGPMPRYSISDTKDPLLNQSESFLNVLESLTDCGVAVAGLGDAPTVGFCVVVELGVTAGALDVTVGALGVTVGFCVVVSAESCVVVVVSTGVGLVTAGGSAAVAPDSSRRTAAASIIQVAGSSGGADGTAG